jgi:hypothetical protein
MEDLQMNVKKPNCLSLNLKKRLAAFQFAFVKIFIQRKN